ncbi:hypothetical protein evm_012795 [Chilo suppressalis]|nr:hypothetical protein evm_012795 [Chilo suppressalis]
MQYYIDELCYPRPSHRLCFAQKPTARKQQHCNLYISQYYSQPSLSITGANETPIRKEMTRALRNALARRLRQTELVESLKYTLFRSSGHQKENRR